MLRKLTLILISFFLFTEISAQTKEIELDLSSKIITDVLQQDSGLLWVGTDEGLNVFFDDEKNVFYSNILDSLSVLNSDINNLIIDSKNNLIYFQKMV